MPSDKKNQPAGSTTLQRFGESEQPDRTELSESQAAASAKAQIEAAYIMAIKRPRNEDQARARLMDRCKNARFAEAAIYKKPVGGSSIEGLSIRFAEDLIALWGNIHVSQQTIYEDAKRRKLRVYVIELESNIWYDSEITVDKTVERRTVSKDRTVISERLNSRGEKVYIVSATEDEINIKCAAQTSKIIRNNGLRCVPGYIKEEALEVMRQTVKGKIEKNPAEERQKLVDAFNDLGIKPDRLAQYVGHSIEELTPAELLQLRQTWNAVNSGETTWKELMDSKRERDTRAEAAKPARGTMKAGNASAHRNPDDPKAALLVQCDDMRTALTSEVFYRLLGDAGHEKPENMTAEELKTFLAACKKTLKG